MRVKRTKSTQVHSLETRAFFFLCECAVSRCDEEYIIVFETVMFSFQEAKSGGIEDNAKKSFRVSMALETGGKSLAVFSQDGKLHFCEQ